MPYEVLCLFDFLTIDSTCMHELLMKVTGMRLKSYFLAEVLKSYFLAEVPSPQEKCSR